jgi:hypothetical protein
MTAVQFFESGGFQSCQIFLGKIYLPKIDLAWYKIPKRGDIYHNDYNNIPNGHKIYEMAVKSIRYDHKIYQHLSLQDTQKVTQIGIFGLKIYHLATLEDFTLLNRDWF